MNYELALKLKNAGFPQDGNGFLMNGKIYADGFSKPTEDIYYPTLEELIDACGERFGKLVMLYEHEVGLQWKAYSKKEYEYIIDTFGKTPKEAVANLYLEINK